MFEVVLELMGLSAMISWSRKKQGLQQGSVLCPMLLIIVLEPLSREISSGHSEEMLYVDDLALVKHLRA